MVSEEFYHGWIIRVGQGQFGYTFKCWIAGEQVGVSDAQDYLTIEQAMKAGRLRADLETVRLSLTTFLRSKFNLLWLCPDERNALENSISQYIDTAKRQLS